MARRFLLCAEDVLSAALARDLCDRVVHELARAEWLRQLWAPELREGQRAWEGLRPPAWWADRQSLDREAEALGIRPHLRVRETGRVRAMRGAAGYAFKGRRVAARLLPPPELVVLAGDADNETDPEALRAAGAEAAGEGPPWLVAEPRRESEAWVIAGFVPRNAAERGRLEALTRELGFDPTAQAERLMSTRPGDARDAKRVARLLLDEGELTPASERVRACWLDTPLEVLAGRGARTGLAEYLGQVERVLLPMLGDDA